MGFVARRAIALANSPHLVRIVRMDCERLTWVRVVSGSSTRKSMPLAKVRPCNGVHARLLKVGAAVNQVDGVVGAVGGRSSLPRRVRCQWR